MTPLWGRLAGGCHLNRPIEHLVVDGRFRVEQIGQGYSRGPRPFAYLYRGLARRAD